MQLHPPLPGRLGNCLSRHGISTQTSQGCANRSWRAKWRRWTLWTNCLRVQVYWLIVRTRFGASERVPEDVTSWTQRHAKEPHLETRLFRCLTCSYIHALLPTHSVLLYLLWGVMAEGFNRLVQVLVAFRVQSSRWLGFLNAFCEIHSRQISWKTWSHDAHIAIGGCGWRDMQSMQLCWHGKRRC